MIKNHSMKLANMLTASRYLLAVSLALLIALDTSLARYLLFFTTLALFLSDALDGMLSRRLGSVSPIIVGTVFDTMADDFVFVTASVCLFWKGILPLWLVLLIFWTRSIMLLVRLLNAVKVEPFAAPRPTTKAKGVGYGIALILLVGIYVLEAETGVVIPQATSQIIVAVVSLLTVIAAVDFVATYRRTVLALFIVTAD